MKIRRREEDDVMAKKSVKHHSKEKTKAEKAREVISITHMFYKHYIRYNTPIMIFLIHLHFV